MLTLISVIMYLACGLFTAMALFVWTEGADQILTRKDVIRKMNVNGGLYAMATCCWPLTLAIWAIYFIGKGLRHLFISLVVLSAKTIKEYKDD